MAYCLIVFVKNPVAGQVKTRVAATVGHPKAVEVYLALLQHTQKVIKDFLAIQPLKVAIYYGDYVNLDDLWDQLPTEKYLQTGLDLGERMKNAFAEQLGAGATKVVIVGSDCLALKPTHLQGAFAALDQHQTVLGPALDGGYYLLGMRQLYSFIFENKPWSNPSLFAETTQQLTAQNVSYELLEPLSDIDTWDDFVRATVA